MKKKDFKIGTFQPHWLIILAGIIILIGGIILVLGLADFSAYTRYEYYTEPTTSGEHNFYGIYRGAMPFRIGTTGTNETFTLKGVAIPMTENMATPVTLNVSVYNTNASWAPTTSIIQNQSVIISSGIGCNWINVSIPGDINLTKGEKYAIVVGVNGTHEAGDAIEWCRDSTGTYSEGFLYFTNVAGAWGDVNTAMDHAFEVYGLGNITISLNSPSNAIIKMNPVIFNCSMISGTNIINSSLWIDGKLNYTKAGGALTDEIYQQRNLSLAWHNWTCESWNNYGETYSNNRTLNIQNFQINSVTYNATTYETATERINLNLSYENSIYDSVSTIINYNGTLYLGIKNGDIFYKTITIPKISSGLQQNLSFYWTIVLTNITGTFYENSSWYNQSVQPLTFVECNGTYTNNIFNISIYNETSRTLINGSLDATFFYYSGEGSITKNWSFDSNNATTSIYKFCASPDKNYTVSTTAKIKNVNFYERLFHLNKESYSSGYPIDKDLYLLDQGEGIIVQVRDSGLRPVEGYFVKVYRYYPASGEYKIIEHAETDEYGQFVARLIEPNTEKYQFEFLDSNNIVKKKTGDMTIACRTSICVLPFVIEEIEDFFEKYKNATGYVSSLIFNNITNITTFSWTDASGYSITSRFEVIRYLFNGTTTLCNSTSSLSSGSLTCNVGSMTASYQAQGFRKTTGKNEQRMEQISFSVGGDYKTFGKEAILWSFLLMITCIALGYWYPPVGAGLFIFGSIALYVTKIIYVNPAILIAELAIAVVFIWAFSEGR